MPIDPSLSFNVFLPHERDHEYEIEHLGDRFIIRTNWGARNFRLMQAPIGSTRRPGALAGRGAAPRRCVPRRFRSVRALHRAIGAHRRPAQDRHPATGAGRAAEEFFIASDEPAYTMAISVNPEIDSDILRYTYSSLTTPTTVYDYDVRTGERTLLKRDPVMGDFDPRELPNRISVRAGAGRQAHPGIDRLSQGFRPQRHRAAAAIRLRRLWAVHGSVFFFGAPEPARSRLRLRDCARARRPGDGAQLVRRRALAQQEELLYRLRRRHA